MNKLLLISGDAVGGIRTHVHTIIRYGLLNGYDMHYIQSNILDQVAKNDFLEFNKNGLKGKSLKMSKWPSFIDIINIIIIRKYCRKNKISVIHGHGAKGGLYARCATAFSSRKSIYTPHGGVFNNQFNQLTSKFFLTVEYILRSLTYFLIFESEYSKSQYEDKVGSFPVNRCRVIYNGIEKCSFKPYKKWNTFLNNEINILIVGMLRSLKGHSIAIDAVSILVKHGYKASLDICGAGPEIDKLKERAKRLNIDRSIRFHGDVSNILHYYEKTNIVIIPSYAESFGYIAIEAALMKRPVIASEVGGLKEIIIHEKTGILVPSGFTEGFANAIKYLMANQDKTNEMIENAYQKSINNFSQKKMISETFSVYSVLLNK